MQILKSTRIRWSLSARGTGKYIANLQSISLIRARYDFDLKTGKSETGLSTCTYAVKIESDDSGEEQIWMEAPEGGRNWRVVELRPVSEGVFSQFAHQLIGLS